MYETKQGERNNMSIKLPENEIEARELHLFIDNDYQLYQQQYLPILKMLTKRKLNGSYDSEKAIKAFENLAYTGARKYHKDNYDVCSACYLPFTPATRRLTAIALRDQYEGEYELGNYSELV